VGVKIGGGARTDYQSESDDVELVEQRGRQRARPEQGRAAALGLKRARSSYHATGVLVEGG
jgi:hypothetical protein